MARSRNAPAWLAAIVVFALMLWWLALAAPDDTQDDVASNEPASPPPSAAEPAPARTTQPAEPAAKVAPALAPAPAVTDPTPESPPERDPNAPIPPDTRGFTDALAGAFDSSERDRDAGSVEAALQRFFRASSLPASAFRTVVCHKTVCRLELYWRAEYDKAYRAAMDELAHDNAKTVATRAEAPDKSGGVSVDAYWLRSIGTLPQPASK